MQLYSYIIIVNCVFVNDKICHSVTCGSTTAKDALVKIIDKKCHSLYITGMTQRKRLDTALDNFQVILSELSEKLRNALEHLEEFADIIGICDLEKFARVAKSLAETTKILAELAPFWSAKQNIEGAEHMIEWLLHTGEYTGENREIIIMACKSYQQSILNDVGFLEKEQYQLL